MAHDSNLGGPLALQQTHGDITPKATASVSHSHGTEAAPPHAIHTPRGYQRFVFTDPIAFRYLEDDPSTSVVERQQILHGYEIYIVEQWACSRIHPTFVITTYTGDDSHTVVVGVLNVPVDEQKWSPRLKTYFNAMAQTHARKRATHLGTLMVTNLSSFPSSFTVIPVPDGNLKLHREDFIVNEDLKRLGCSGRAGLNLKTPAPGTEDKFHQLYRTNSRIPFYAAVQELVKLCQIALTIFDKLLPEYADGLLCDVTERAINDWWTDIGTDLFNIEPNDGILGPTTVAALLGTLMGARNRLHASGAPISKDVFDTHSFKKGIGSFQKAQKLEKTRRLDRQTLDKLHRVTAKAASGDGWAVPRAVKSTVAELGGKGGEMVMGIVAGRDKAGISEVETLDIDRFIRLAIGRRSKWLWRGKTPKTGNEAQHDAGDDEMVFTHGEHGGYVWARKKKGATSENPSARPSLEVESPWKLTEIPTTPDDKDQSSKSGLKKSVTTKVSDARAGLGRFRDAVGIPNLRSHHRKHSKDILDLDSRLPYHHQLIQGGGAHYIAENGRGWETLQPPAPQFAKDNSEPAVVDDVDLTDIKTPPSGSQQQTSVLDLDKTVEETTNHGSDTATAAATAAADSVSGQSPVEVVEDQHDISQTRNPIVARVLRHSNSFPDLSFSAFPKEEDAQWPRHLSFSGVDETILTWDPVGDLQATAIKPEASLTDATLFEDMITSDVRDIGDEIANLESKTSVWVERQVSAVQLIDDNAEARLEELVTAYQAKLEEYQSLRAGATELIAREGGVISESAKRVETYGAKLDYELHMLQARVEEVEEGITNYERRVIELEARSQNVIKGDEDKSGQSWWSWGLQLFNSPRYSDI